jgi:hypothetical protein
MFLTSGTDQEGIILLEADVLTVLPLGGVCIIESES